jgi:hypothetical protein
MSSGCRTAAVRCSKRYLEVGRFWLYLSMPGRRLFDSVVCRGIVSLTAAPLGPDMRQWVGEMTIISTP